MKKLFVLTAVLLILFSGLSFGAKADSFEQAKILSAESNLPILLEFVHED